MKNVFDYVIVGAGSAGCVLANRLTADGRTTVALVEAGGPDDKQEIHIPAAFSKLFKSAYDWAYFTEEQPQLNNRRLYWPRGKVLGGSSSLNAMIYTQGHPADFDEWQRLGGDGWGWADVAPAFGKTLLDVSELRTKNPLSSAFVAACGEEGIARNDDFNGARMDGAGFFHVTQTKGKRCSTAAAYLTPALKRPNLTVLTKTLTTRVLFAGTRATGVECGTTTFHAEREVLLCGGAINSPQLLLLSGVGAADDLRKLGIAVVADVPGVGRNLQDHLIAGTSFACTQPVSLARAESIGNIARYLLFHEGMLSSNVAEAGAFVRVGAGEGVPDIELIFGPTYYMNHGYDNPPGHGFTLGAILLHPRTRGTIKLRSTDATQAPAIDPDYLREEGDFALLRDGVKLCQRVARAKAFAPFRGAEVWPGARDDFDAYLRDTAETLYHPVGTCRMGNDAEAVVDSRLCVRGVDGLRVIDGSVMPTIVTGHPNAAIVMIAERAAEMVQG